MRLLATRLLFSIFPACFFLVSAPAGAASGDSGKADLLIPIGMSVNIGAGVSGFTDKDMRDFAEVAGNWEARLAVGTRSIVGFEAAYLGGAQNIDALGLDKKAVLVATGLEGNAKINLPLDMWRPYVIAGVGWRHYSLARVDTNTSSVTAEDDVFELQGGAGVSFQYKHFIADARTVIRPAFDADLIRTVAGEDDTPLHTWSSRLSVGWEF